ncbi:hypothetical protein FGW84_00555, partial [Xylella fastidiosa subsp. multiplex]|uniref:hypothetical protein n=1 Tax=Xylella fastidiosa TaxID=2371 RepID=UPI0012ADA2E9
AKETIDITLGADGHLVHDIVLPEGAKPVSPMAVVVSGSVYESGRRPVTRSLKRGLWPADALVGVRPLVDVASGADANGMARF